MATNFRFNGTMLSYVAVATVASGDAVAVGSLVGIASKDAAIGETVELALTGVWEVPKTAAQAWTQGAPIYWDGSEATTSASGNTFMGHAFGAAANPSGTGLVRLAAIA